MFHRLFNFATAMSLALCVATAVVWVRSYSRQEVFAFNRSHILVDVVAGKLVFGTFNQKMNSLIADVSLGRIFLVASVFPVWRLLFALAEAWQRRHRVRTGVCTGCGYDLTGNTSGVCPECGMATGTGTGNVTRDCPDARHFLGGILP